MVVAYGQTYDQWYRIEGWKGNPYNYSRLTFNKDVNRTPWKRMSFQQIVLIQVAIHRQNKVEIEAELHTMQKNLIQSGCQT